MNKHQPISDFPGSEDRDIDQRSPLEGTEVDDTPNAPSPLPGTGEIGDHARGYLSPRQGESPVVHLGSWSLGALGESIEKHSSFTLATAPTTAGAFKLAALQFPNGDQHIVEVERLAALFLEHPNLRRTPARVFGADQIMAADDQIIIDLQLAARLLFAGVITAPATLGEARQLLRMPSVEALPPFSPAPSGDEVRRLLHHSATFVKTADRLELALDAEGLSKIFQLEQAFRPVLFDIERNGMRLNVNRWRGEISAAEGELPELRSRVKKALGIADPSDADAVRDRLRAAGVHETAAERLENWQHIPGVRDLVEFRRLSSFVNDTGPNVLAAYEKSLDERVRATWNALGTDTGRATCEVPSLLNVPRTRRSAFLPAPGASFVFADYSAAQLRIIAEHVHDEPLLDLFAGDSDPHCATAATIYDVSEIDVTADQRDSGKKINFGIIFGKGSASLAADLGCSAEHASSFMKRFFDAHPGISTWHRETKNDLPTLTRALCGRVKHFGYNNKNPNSRLAAPIQGAEASIIKRALVLMAPQLRAVNAMVVLVHYDSVLVEVASKVAETAEGIVKHSMLQAMQECLPNVRAQVSHRIVTSWG